MRRVPADEIQRAILLALDAADVCGGRIYDDPPARGVFPYVTIGEEQIIEDGDACSDGYQVVATLHAWSRPEISSKAEVKELAAEIVSALRAIETIEDFDLISGELETSRTLRDPDGKTEHAVITYRFIITPA